MSIIWHNNNRNNGDTNININKEEDDGSEADDDDGSQRYSLSSASFSDNVDCGGGEGNDGDSTILKHDHLNQRPADVIFPWQLHSPPESFKDPAQRNPLRQNYSDSNTMAETTTAPAGMLFLTHHFSDTHSEAYF